MTNKIDYKSLKKYTRNNTQLPLIYLLCPIY